MRPVLILIAAVLLAFAPLTAQAQAATPLPEHGAEAVYDWADLLDPAQEAALTDQLDKLLADDKIAMVVVTLTSMQPYGYSMVEGFATDLFNKWGIGDAKRNDGILIVVASEDRQMRIELGSGYGTAFNDVAQQIIDGYMLPRFRDEDYAQGILSGVSATIERIAQPMAKNEAPRKLIDWNKIMGMTAMGILLGAFALMFIWQFVRGQLTRFRRCPTCGQRTLHMTRKTTIPATGKQSGQGIETITCDNCNYHDTRNYTIPARSRSSSSGGSFGGGSSSGGGASGRW